MEQDVHDGSAGRTETAWELLGRAPATPFALRTLAAAGLLDRAALARALARIEARPTPRTWHAFARRQLLVVGAALSLAGAVFFVAANWSALPDLGRMGLVAGAMALATLAGGVLGLRALAGRVALALGGALLGPLLAVYGQTYQTGADAWNLFAVWALVFTGHALLVRHAAAWIGWLALAHVAALLWIGQSLGEPLLTGSRALAVAGIAAFDAAAVALAHRLLPPGEGRYLARAAALLGLAVLTTVGMHMVIELEIAPGQWPCAIALPAAWAAMALRYRRRAPDLFMLFLLAVSVLAMAGGLAAQLVFEALDLDELGLWVMGALVCAEVWALARWLLRWRAIHEQMRGGTP